MIAQSIQSAADALMAGEFPSQVGAWIGTYLVHGVCLFVLAAVATRWIHSARVTEQFWRAALFGPLVTASLQLGAGVDPVGGLWDLPVGAEAPQTVATAAFDDEASATYRLHLDESDALAARLDELSDEAILLVANLAQIDEEPAAPASREAAVISDVLPADSPLVPSIALLLLTAGIGALLVRAFVEAVRVTRLGSAKTLTGGPLVEMVTDICEAKSIHRRIRVQLAPAGASPYATGVLFPRIVIPEQAYAALDDDSIRAMLAHEAGHVARFDPLWTAAARSVTALFFFQPLNWITARKLDESAEFCCDEFAVDVTGNEVALARCLTAVADWIVEASSIAARPACAMAHRRSPLAERVERILETEGAPKPALTGTRLIGSLAIVATAMAAPGFAAAAAEPSPHRAIVEAPVGIMAPSPSSAPSSSPFDALALALDALRQDIDELILIASDRDLPEVTVLRLIRLHDHAARIAAVVAKAQQSGSRR